MACCLYDGLQEVLGEPNVVDAIGCPWLHNSELACDLWPPAESERKLDSFFALDSISGQWEGRRLDRYDKDFDLIVVHACANRDGDWGRVLPLLDLLRPGGKVAFVEGWDAAWQVSRPDFRIDAYFRKEIMAGVGYPGLPHHLGFAAPARWFEPVPVEDAARPYDVVFVGNPDSAHPGNPEMRWRMLSDLFRTRRHHCSVAATRGLGVEEYWRLLRQAKLALCPAAADGADSLRTYEAVAAGAVPVFVGYPDHVREPWFTGEHAIFCDSGTLVEHLDEALGHDQTAKRRALLAHAKEEHTTRARAEKLLRCVGLL